MAEEIILETLSKEELRTKAEGLAIAYNSAITNEDMKAANAAETELDAVLKAHKKVSETECFRLLKNTEDPMLEAIKQLTFTTIRAKDNKVGELKIPVRVIEEVEKPIDLLKLHEYVGGDGIGKDSFWWATMQRFNMLLTAQRAVDLGINPKFIDGSYAMCEIAKQRDLGKNPTSKTNLLRTLQAVITCMIGSEYRATSHDVNYLLSIYSKKSRQALCVKAANHKLLTSYMAEICHRIVEEKGYSIEFKQVPAKA